MPAMWPTCLIRRKQPSSSRKPPPRARRPVSEVTTRRESRPISSFAPLMLMADKQLHALQPMSVHAPTDSCLSAKSANGSLKATHEESLYEKSNCHRVSRWSVPRLYLAADQITCGDGGRSPRTVRR